MMQEEALHRLPYMTNVAQAQVSNNNWRQKLGHKENIKYQMIILQYLFDF